MGGAECRQKTCGKGKGSDKGAMIDRDFGPTVEVTVEGAPANPRCPRRTWKTCVGVAWVVELLGAWGPLTLRWAQ